MNCANCFGRGWEPIVIYRSHGVIIGMDGRRPCPECHGASIVACCDGDCAMNDFDWKEFTEHDN